MNNRFISTVLGALGAAGAVHAQSPVNIYGVLDTGLQHLSSSNGTSLTHMMKMGHVPSRIGFTGSEDLGDGVQASFVLETPIFVDAGSLPPDGKMFGRQAYVSLGAARYGELRLGRQFSVMQTALAQYDPDHFSPFSPALAMQLANVEQTSLDNMISYLSPSMAGFSLQLAGTLGEKTALTPNQANPQIVGAGTARNGSAAMLQYRRGGLGGVLAYQGGGENLSAGGKALQKIFTAGVNYRFEAFEVGSILWRHRNTLPSSLAPAVTACAVGGAWRVVPSVRLNVELGAAEDNGLVYATGAAKAKGTNRYLNVGANYDLSKRTTAYVRAGRVTDRNGGYNGRPIAVSPSGRDGVAVPMNGAVDGLALGLRHAF